MQLIDASDSSLMVVFGEAISPELNRRVINLFHKLQAEADPRIRNLHPSFCVLLIDYDPARLPPEQLRAHVSELAEQEHAAVAEAAPRTVTIPVCYGGELGPDLKDVCEHTKLSPEELIKRHGSVEYKVYFIGFSPGFAHLGGMPESLATPRLKTPRTSVPAGSVGIGGVQTGIYPMQWSGGWRLIGRTPLLLFDPEANPPSLLDTGDLVKFEAISRESFDAMVASR